MVFSFVVALGCDVKTQQHPHAERQSVRKRLLLRAAVERKCAFCATNASAKIRHKKQLYLYARYAHARTHKNRSTRALKVRETNAVFALQMCTGLEVLSVINVNRD